MLRFVVALVTSLLGFSVFAQDTHFKCTSATYAGVIYTIEGCVSAGGGNLYSACLNRVEPLVLTRTQPSVEVLVDYIKGAVTRTTYPVSEKYEFPANLFDYSFNDEEEYYLSIQSNIDSFIGTLNLDFTGGEGIPANLFTFDLNLNKKYLLTGKFKAVGCEFTPYEVY